MTDRHRLAKWKIGGGDTVKVVLFCGGFGMRMRDDVDDVPKPMQMVGDRPLIWHVMRTYAFYGHTDFILCLGFGAQHIVDFFRGYDETRSNDFVLRNGAREVQMLSTDIADWTITFIHTGIDTPIGERLRRVRPYLDDDEVFAANYADVLTDAPLDLVEAEFRRRDVAVSLLSVPPQAAFHMVDEEDGLVTRIRSVAELDVRENGGYFFLTPEVFDHLDVGEDLVTHALPRLSARGRVMAWRHDGFWKPADTVKERSELDTMARRRARPWAVWDEAAPAAAPDTPAGITTVNPTGVS